MQKTKGESVPCEGMSSCGTSLIETDAFLMTSPSSKQERHQIMLS